MCVYVGVGEVKFTINDLNCVIPFFYIIFLRVQNWGLVRIYLFNQLSLLRFFMLDIDVLVKQCFFSSL